MGITMPQHAAKMKHKTNKGADPFFWRIGSFIRYMEDVVLCFSADIA